MPGTELADRRLFPVGTESLRIRFRAARWMLAELRPATPGRRWTRRPRPWIFCAAACSEGVSRLPFRPLEESDQLSDAVVLPSDYVDQLPRILSPLVGHAIKLLFRLRNRDAMLPAKYRGWRLDHNRLANHGGRKARRRGPYIQRNGLHLRRVATRDRDLEWKGSQDCSGRSADRDGIRAHASGHCLRVNSVRKLGQVEIKLRPGNAIRGRSQA